MMERFTMWLSVSAVFLACGLASPTWAGPAMCPQKEIVFLMDGSGSISPADFAIEKDGLQAAISNPNLVPLDGTLTLGLVQFGNGTTAIEVPLTRIETAADRDAVLAAIAGITQIGGGTNPGDGINTAAGMFAAGVCDPARGAQQICLITDGLPNEGADPPAALAAAQGSAWGLDGFGVMAIEDPGFFTAADAQAYYGPLIFGGGGVTVVANALEFANFVGPTCFGDALKLVGIEVNQAIQDWGNTVQLIEGKRTWVRCHIEPADPMVMMTVAQARLRGFRGGVELPGSPLTAINPGGQIIAMQNAAMRRATLNDSLNFILPTSWTNGSIVLELQAVGAGIDCSMAASTNADCMTTVPLTFVSTDTPEIRWVRVTWTDGAGTSFTPTAAHVRELRRRFNAIYPISTHTAANDTHTYRGALDGSGLPQLGTLNSELGRKRFFDLCWSILGCDEIYYGILRSANVGGLAAGIPSSVSSGEMPAAAFGYGRNRHAHEIAHNLGRRHATFCGAVDASAPAFPYTAMIGGQTVATLGPMAMGDDAFIYGMDTHARAVVDPNVIFEMMSYCIAGQYRWISKFSYDAVKTALDATFLVPSYAGGPGEYLIVSGVIDLATDLATIDPLVVIDAPARPPSPPPGDYAVRVWDAADLLIAEIPFEPDVVAPDLPGLGCGVRNGAFSRRVHGVIGDSPEGGGGGPDPMLATFIVPVPNDPAIVRATIVHNGVDIGDTEASSNPPTVSIVYPTGGESILTDTVTFEWDGDDVDGDPLTYIVQYSADSGMSWTTLAVDTPNETLSVPRAELEASGEATIRVYASDGFHSSVAVSNPFSVGNNAPTLSIISPVQGSFYTGVQLLYFDAEAFDPEEGEFDGATFQWSSDVDGSLGTGDDFELLGATFTEGVHVITCTVTDSMGATASDSVSIVVQSIFEFMDCNGNGVSDLLDISDGISEDCNVNFIPDECDIDSGMSGDCNLNGTPDECDIAAGLEEDCNGNGVPDSCDLLSGTSLDCNSNGLPDECDIAAGTELDCNSNGVPDDCDLSAGTSLDCNLNGIPDECDIATGLELDCNFNGVPDACDLSAGTSEDCNSNGIPDECDIASGFSTDTNGDGIPDECAEFVRGDSNADGTIELADAVHILTYLTGGGPAICFDAMDVDDDGVLNIVDPIVLLSYIFSGGALPPPPSMCGPDPTLDSLDCFGPVPTCP